MADVSASHRISDKSTMYHDRTPYSEYSPDPMWIHDIPTHRFIDLNDTAVRTYASTDDEFLAMTTPDLLPPCAAADASADTPRCWPA